MDKHLNLFYSYSQGSLQNFERAKQLEDNLTRALIVTLKSLDIKSQKQFIELLLSKKIKSETLDYDLQNTNKYAKSKDVNKYLIVLQRENSKVSIDDILHLDNKILGFLESNEIASINKDIKAHIRKGEDFRIGGKIIPLGQLHSISHLLSGNRPDAWIIGDKEVCLFETKIGNNSVSPYQIYRHITGREGLYINIKDLKTNNNNLTIINVKWEEVCKYFEIVNNNNFIVNQFIKYITMTGQILNFDYIINNEIDDEIQKEQMNLFLNEIDKELVSRGSKLERKNRGKGAKSGLWEPYGIKNDDGKIGMDPHFTIYFDEKSLGIRMTTKKHKQVNAELLKEIEKYYVEKTQTNVYLSMYGIYMCQYKLVDYKNGQILGENYFPFKFELRFSELTEKGLPEIKQSILSFTKLKLYKQFEIGFSIDFFDFDKIKPINKEKQIRYRNKVLLSNPELVVKAFVDFMKETEHMFELMRNNKGNSSKKTNNKGTGGVGINSSENAEDILSIVHKMVAKKDWVEVSKRKSAVHFLTRSLERSIPKEGEVLKGKESCFFEILLSEKNLRLKILVPPGNEYVRNILFNALSNLDFLKKPSKQDKWYNFYGHKMDLTAEDFAGIDKDKEMLKEDLDKITKEVIEAETELLNYKEEFQKYLD